MIRVGLGPSRMSTGTMMTIFDNSDNDNYDNDNDDNDKHDHADLLKQP